MSHLGEEAEAFFKKGDEGTYEGGPRSLTPSSCDLPVEEDDTLTAEVIAGQLERRTRMQHLVTKVVGGLGIGLLFLLPLRSMTPRTDATPLQPAAAHVDAPAAVAVVPEARVAAPSPPAPTAAPIASPTARAHAKHARAVHSQQQGNRPSPAVTMPTRTVAALPLSRVHRLPSSHVPPTATFPD